MNINDDERKRREGWIQKESDGGIKRGEAMIGLLGAAFLGFFLLFSVFQGSGPIFGSFNGIVKGLQNPIINASPASSNSSGVILLPGAVNSSGTSSQNPTVVSTKAVSTPVTPTSAPVPEGPINVLFTGGSSAVQANRTYSGAVTLTVSGTGQAQGKSYSDAFYIYTDEKGNNVTPVHHPFATLCINGQAVDHFVQSIPPYNAAHTYTFTMTAPGGPLTFGICDAKIKDNTGSLTIKF